MINNGINGSFAPNVLVSDMGKGIEDICSIIRREEMNIIRTGSRPQDILSDTSSPNVHMTVIRDEGLENNSFGVIESIRSFSDVPILVISDAASGDNSEMYRIMALSKGADACLGSDFGTFELKARMLSLLRRYTGENSTAKPECSTGIITNGIITVDRKSREVYSSGSHVKLTAIEYGIVEYLITQCGKVCPVEDIYRNVWRESPYSVKKTVVEHIRRIRCKLEPDPHNPRYIKAVFGIGYKMEKIS
ncbi:MAG: winged helix-turn-helix domain-containing protein [Huintestinicola sp.]